ncbi:MAG: exosome complex RNA-binding protein Csl4 [Candidatus Hermodarchaeota archaeon]
MTKNNDHDSNNDWVLPGDKIAVIEEFLPDETCYEQDGGIYSKVLGRIVTDPKKHKISVIPKKPYLDIKIGDLGVGRVELIKKQNASVNIYQINQILIPLPISAMLHISEVSLDFVKNMYEVTRPGDWLKFRIIRSNKPIYISLIGDKLGVIVSYCIRCGYELKFKRRNTLECPNCNLIQPRMISREYGNPLNYKLGPSRNETR